MESPVDPMRLYEGLQFLHEVQEPMIVAFGHDNVDPDTLARYAAALMIEVAEFSNEVPWKVWATTEKDLSAADVRAAVAEEFADVLHYVGSWVVLLGLMGLSRSDLTAAFLEKNLRNRERFAQREEST